jgi:ubiquinone/menaquinone biosynthesis C-methylase UbiE
MSLQKDPEKNEWKHLRQLADFTGKRVLEIGCGEGRMTWQYARGTHQTVGIDPDQDSLRVATVDKPTDLTGKAYFARATAEHLPFSKETFDLAILAWSL